MKNKAWPSGEQIKQPFHYIRNRLQQAEVQLRKMETYVTSREFELNR